VAWLLRGSGQQLPPHSIVDGLAGPPDEVAEVVGKLFDEIPEGGRGLGVGHTPLVEEAALGLTGTVVQPLAECEGVRLIRADDGTTTLEELRR
jgi:hypothetical protein